MSQDHPAGPPLCAADIRQIIREEIRSALADQRMPINGGHPMVAGPHAYDVSSYTAPGSVFYQTGLCSCGRYSGPCGCHPMTIRT